jgi:uncharacterized protein (TIGR02452 family)
MNDFERARVAKETRNICKKGFYQHPVTKRPTSIAEELKFAIDNTTFIADGVRIEKPQVKEKPRETKFAVINATTLEVAASMDEYADIVTVQNFASGHHVGGGYLKGRDAQEEYLCRATGLYECLSRSKCAKFYVLANSDKPGLNSDNVILSPRVPVFRKDDSTLREEVSLVNVISCAGVNMRKTTNKEYEHAMNMRCRRVLEAAVGMGAKYLVLGAFGAGVFRNDPHKVAGYFSAWLKKDFYNVFTEVVFAIAGPEDSPNLKAFEYAFKKREATHPAQLLLDELEEDVAQLAKEYAEQVWSSDSEESELVQDDAEEKAYESENDTWKGFTQSDIDEVLRADQDLLAAIENNPNTRRERAPLTEDSEDPNLGN